MAGKYEKDSGSDESTKVDHEVRRLLATRAAAEIPGVRLALDFGDPTSAPWAAVDRA